MTYSRDLKNIVKAVKNGKGNNGKYGIFYTDGEGKGIIDREIDGMMFDGVLIQKCDSYGYTRTYQRLKVSERLVASITAERNIICSELNLLKKVVPIATDIDDSNVLKNELINLLNKINEQIEVISAKAIDMGIDPNAMLNMDGTWVMIDLLHSKAQILSALTMFNVDITKYNITNVSKSDE